MATVRVLDARPVNPQEWTPFRVEWLDAGDGLLELAEVTRFSGVTHLPFAEFYHRLEGVPAQAPGSPYTGGAGGVWTFCGEEPVEAGHEQWTYTTWEGGMRLTIAEFNTPEFWGRGGNIPGGYGYYLPERFIVDPAFNASPENDGWRRKAQVFLESGGLVGRTVLELGCAWGSLVRQLRQLGADAYGLDLPYPISQGLELWPELGPYLIVVADAVAWLQDPARRRNEWDVVVSRGFLDCLSNAQLDLAIPRINYICKFQQVHAVDPSVDPAFYNQKTLAEWQSLPWEPGTIILDTAN